MPTDTKTDTAPESKKDAPIARSPSSAGKMRDRLLDAWGETPNADTYRAGQDPADDTE